MTARADDEPLRTGCVLSLLGSLLAAVAPHATHLPVWVCAAVVATSGVARLAGLARRQAGWQVAADRPHSAGYGRRALELRSAPGA